MYNVDMVYRLMEIISSIHIEDIVNTLIKLLGIDVYSIVKEYLLKIEFKEFIDKEMIDWDSMTHATHANAMEMIKYRPLNTSIFYKLYRRSIQLHRYLHEDLNYDSKGYWNDVSYCKRKGDLTKLCKNMDKINWNNVSFGYTADAVKLLEGNINKTNWYNLSHGNCPAAITLLSKHACCIHWELISMSEFIYKWEIDIGYKQTD
jgi:hypothetical protein